MNNIELSDDTVSPSIPVVLVPASLIPNPSWVESSTVIAPQFRLTAIASQTSTKKTGIQKYHVSVKVPLSNADLGLSGDSCCNTSQYSNAFIQANLTFTAPLGTIPVARERAAHLVKQIIISDSLLAMMVTGNNILS